ncbi:MAG: acyl-CoA dehydrogenase family protein [Chloroflexi bacterium]|nr:acyl-CoA dehydrogenase family protein [Chloroflexota bacterium]
MDLSYSAEDEAYRRKVRDWFDQNQPGPQHTHDQRRAWHRKLYDAGFIGMGWPKAYGGWEARPIEQAILGEEMARRNVPGGVNGLGIGFIGPTLIVHGTEEQKRRYLPKILTAEEIWCQLYSEPNAGSDLAGLRTSAVKESFEDGDYYMVNGQKVWTSSAHLADFAVLLARSDPDVPKHRGISYFIFDMHAPGVEVRPLKQITGNAEFNEVFFDNVKVPAENLIGREGQGWELAQTTLGFERGGGLLGRVIHHQTGLSRLIEVCNEASRNGGSALEDPVVRQKLGQMLVEVEVLHSAALRLLSRAEKGQRPGPESSIDKLFYSEMDKRHQEMIQSILGPYGQLEDLMPDLALSPEAPDEIDGTWVYNFLRSRAGTIYSGSSEIQKNIIGERVLGLPREPRADRG